MADLFQGLWDYLLFIIIHSEAFEDIMKYDI